MFRKRCQKIKKLIINFLKRISGLLKVESNYLKAVTIKEENEHLGNALLRASNIKICIHGNLNNLPKEGPLITISNHPYGMAEGVALLSILHNVRKDYKLVANQFLQQNFPLLTNDMILVDVYKTNKSVNENKKSIKNMIKKLKNNESIGFFPSGEVSHWKWNRFYAKDPEWSNTPAVLAKRTGASMVPITFHGCNPFVFQILGLIHPILRTALIPSMFLFLKMKTIHISIGKPIDTKKVNSFTNIECLTSFIRTKTEENINNYV